MMSCPYCGETIENESKFCPKCGKVLNLKISEQVKENSEETNVDAQNRKEEFYNSAVEALSKADDKSSYENVQEMLKFLSGYKDADELAKQCQEKIDELKIAKKAAIKKRNSIIASVSAFVLVCVATVAAVKVVIPTLRYNNAVKLMNEEKYDEAMTAFEKIAGYKDSDELATSCEWKNKWKNKWKDVEVGDTVEFGSYEQDNDTSNGTEPIEWTVMLKDDDTQSILLWSEKGLDCVANSEDYYESRWFHIDDTAVTNWENSLVREWLNDTFFDEAFTDEEQYIIQTTKLDSGAHVVSDDISSGDVTDKIFIEAHDQKTSEMDYLDGIVNLDEAFVESGILEKINERDLFHCFPTDYALAKGALTDSNGYAYEWIRMPYYQDQLVEQSKEGQMMSSQDNFDYSCEDFDYACVRPAMWISID